MNNIQQKLHTYLVVGLILGLFGDLNAMHSPRVRVEVANHEECIVSKNAFKELAQLSKKTDVNASADKDTVVFQSLVKEGLEQLIRNLAAIRNGGRELDDVFKDYFADKKCRDILECRRRLEQGDSLGIVMLQAADYLGIDSIQSALIAYLKKRSDHKKELRPLYSEEKMKPLPLFEESQSEDCVICLEKFAETHKDQAVGLVCNHDYHKDCIEQWAAAKGSNKSCPQCRTAISYKATGFCVLCNDPIDMREESVFYDCNYRTYCGWVYGERHICHRRCIEPYARKASYVSDEPLGLDIMPGEIVFQCPFMHKHRCPNARTDLKTRLSAVVPAQRINRGDFTTKVKTQTLCEICHKNISSGQKESLYTCKWKASVFYRSETTHEHHFHEACLKPYAQRAAFKKENGQIVFRCPAEHDGVMQWEELIVPLLPGFEAEHVDYFCGICHDKVDGIDVDLVMLEYDGFPSGCLTPGSWTRISEKNWYHSKCYGKFLAAHAKKTVSWGGEERFVYPCPYHHGTSSAHEFELSHHTVVEEPGK